MTGVPAAMHSCCRQSAAKACMASKPLFPRHSQVLTHCSCSCGLSGSTHVPVTALLTRGSPQPYHLRPLILVRGFVGCC